MKHEGELDHVAVAVLEKDADGKLEMDRHDSTAKHLAWGGGLLGGALVVLAPPLGAVAHAGTGAEAAGAGANIGPFWHNIPKDDLRRMSDMLDAGQAALVVVAVDHTGQHVGAPLSNATNKIVVDTTAADFEAAFSQVMHEAKTAS